MALRERWLKEALSEFEATLQYVYDNFGHRTAEHVYAGVLSRVKQLCMYPNIGEVYKELHYLGHQVRILHMKMSSIIYCHDEKNLVIISFWNNRRNPAALREFLEDDNLNDNLNANPNANS